MIYFIFSKVMDQLSIEQYKFVHFRSVLESIYIGRCLGQLLPVFFFFAQNYVIMLRLLIIQEYLFFEKLFQFLYLNNPNTHQLKFLFFLFKIKSIRFFFCWLYGYFMEKQLTGDFMINYWEVFIVIVVELQFTIFN